MRKQIKTEDRINDLINSCRSCGIKVTQQRIEIFRELINSSDHPDAEKLFQRLRARMPALSLDTVYRTLWMLNDSGLVSTMGLAREKTRFDGNLTHHHHFVCTVCGSIADFYSSSLDAVEIPESVKELGKISNTHVEVRGTCKKCSKNSEKSE